MVSSSVKILGSRVHILGIPDILAVLEDWIDGERTNCRHVVVTGFHGLWEAHKHPQFKAIVNSADLWVPDGIAPIWIARIRGFKGAQRTPGMDLMKAFLEMADRKRYGSFFYGDTQDTLTHLRENLEQRYPGHRVDGTFSPPFRSLTPEEDHAVVRMINESRPDVLWVGLGLPKQEQWIHEHKDRLDVPVAIGVGAAFGFLSGRVKRCPDWIGNHGLEWVWRFLCEPKKLWRRDLLDGPRFIFHVLLELTGIRKYD